MLRFSYSDHFLSVIHASLHPLTFSNDFSFEAAEPVLHKFHMEPLELREQKIAKMAAVHWQRWQPCLCMVKTFKNLLLQNRGCLGLILCTNHWGREVYQSCLNNGLTLTFDLLQWGQGCFPIHFYRRHIFVWEKWWEFQTASHLKPLAQCCSNFMWSLLGSGEWKFTKNGHGSLTKMTAMPIYGKTFKNLLQNKGCLWAESLHK